MPQVGNTVYAPSQCLFYDSEWNPCQTEVAAEDFLTWWMCVQTV